MINVFTDGSARGNPGPGGWGAILVYENSNDQETRNKKQWVAEIGGREDHTTNNRMELTAAISALEFVASLQAASSELQAVVYTDSEYVMKGITIWIHDWQKRGWRTAAKKPVLNQDLWQELLLQTEGKQIEWKYVAGHAGHEANERCDEIATSFADNAPATLYNGPRENYNVAL
jgi:ribonuclease HI